MGCGLIILSIVANQKAKYVAQKLNKIVRDQVHTKPFEFHNKGSLAYLGDWCVVLDPERNVSDSNFTGKQSMIGLVLILLKPRSLVV
jgi:NADH dehydrogenase FAD-containing subunit